MNKKVASLKTIGQLFATLALVAGLGFTVYQVTRGGYYKKSSKAGVTPEKVFSDGYLKQYYLLESGFNNVNAEFGISSMASVGGDLYVGIASGDSDGAMVAKLNYQKRLTQIPIGTYDGVPVSQLPPNDSKLWEQALYYMHWNDSLGTIVVPGNDPADPVGQWNFGNFYVLNRNNNYLEKYRKTSGLIDVVHLFTTIDDGGVMYAGGGAYPHWPVKGANAPRKAFGQIYKSTDGGKKWIRLTPDPYSRSTFDLNYFISDFRFYVAGVFDGKLYAANKYGSGTHLYYSDNYKTAQEGKIELKKIDGLELCSPIVIKHKDSLIGFSGSTGSYSGCGRLFVLGKGNKFTEFSTPFVGSMQNNSLISVGDYIYAKDNRTPFLYRTKDYRNWELVYNFGDPINTLHYWQDLGVILVATTGENANLWKVSKDFVLQNTCEVDVTGTVYLDMNSNGKMDPGDKTVKAKILQLRGMDQYGQSRVYAGESYNDGRYVFKNVNAAISKYEIYASYDDSQAVWSASFPNQDFSSACGSRKKLYEADVPLKVSYRKFDLVPYSGVYNDGGINKTFNNGMKIVSNNEVEVVIKNDSAVDSGALSGGGMQAAILNDVVTYPNMFLAAYFKARAANPDMVADKTISESFSVKKQETKHLGKMSFNNISFEDYMGKYLCMRFYVAGEANVQNNVSCLKLSGSTCNGINYVLEGKVFLDTGEQIVNSQGKKFIELKGDSLAYGPIEVGTYGAGTYIYRGLKFGVYKLNANWQNNSGVWKYSADVNIIDDCPADGSKKTFDIPMKLENPSPGGDAIDAIDAIVLDKCSSVNYSLGGTVFNDSNQNGTKDTSETVINSRGASLVTLNGISLKYGPVSVGTYGAGYYNFGGLKYGSYNLSAQWEGKSYSKDLEIIDQCPKSGSQAEVDVGL